MSSGLLISSLENKNKIIGLMFLLLYCISIIIQFMLPSFAQHGITKCPVHTKSDGSARLHPSQITSATDL